MFLLRQIHFHCLLPRQLLLGLFDFYLSGEKNNLSNIILCLPKTLLTEIFFTCKFNLHYNIFHSYWSTKDRCNLKTNEKPDHIFGLVFMVSLRVIVSITIKHTIKKLFREYLLWLFLFGRFTILNSLYNHSQNF